MPGAARVASADLYEAYPKAAENRYYLLDPCSYWPLGVEVVLAAREDNPVAAADKRLPFFLTEVQVRLRLGKGHL